MSTGRWSIVLVGALALGACGGANENTAPDPSLSAAIEEQFPDPSTDPTVAPTLPATTPTTAPAEPWEGDADAAIAAIEEYLRTEHAGAIYTPSIVEVAVDPVSGTAVITTTLPAGEVDTTTRALALCDDASIVAFLRPANLRRLEVTDPLGTVLAAVDDGGTCA